MKLSKIPSEIPGYMFLALFIAAVVLSVWIVVSGSGRRVEALLTETADKYDLYMPEITIKGGQAGVKKKQPYFVDTGDPTAVIVIDTREDNQNEAMNYLKDAETGAVLTKTTLITKSRSQLRVIYLRDIPDFTVNSANLKDLMTDYYPMMMKIAAVILIVYFFIAKSVQVLLFALIPFFASKKSRLPIRYGEAVKFSTAALICAVILDFLLSFLNVGTALSLFGYFVVYLTVIAIISVELIKQNSNPSDETASVEPR